MILQRNQFCRAQKWCVLCVMNMHGDQDKMKFPEKATDSPKTENEREIIKTRAEMETKTQPRQKYSGKNAVTSFVKYYSINDERFRLFGPRNDTMKERERTSQRKCDKWKNHRAK